MSSEVGMGLVWLGIAAAMITLSSFGIAAVFRRMRASPTTTRLILLIAALVALIAFALAGGCFGLFGAIFLGGGNIAG